MTDTTSRSTRREAVARYVPMLQWLPEYRRVRLGGDVLAGVIVAALLIPQSLGYVRIAGVPVEVGLYSVPLALLAYAVLGSSRQLHVGPASTVAIVSGSLVVDITADNPQDAVAITSALAITAGVVLVGIGVLRVAWLAEFLSKPIVTGFVFGLTLTIVVGEFPTMLGIEKPSGDLIAVLGRTGFELDQTHVPTALVGGAALAVLFAGRRLAARVPWGLVTLIAGVAASQLLDLEADGVAVVGSIPAGLPPISLPLIPRDDVGEVIVGGMSIALVALAEGLAAARLFATRGGYRVETERELVGMGAANVAAGVSGGMGVAGSLSKTAAADQAGATSQLSSLTAAVLVVAVLVAFTSFIEPLPLAVLSAIVVNAVWGLMDIAAMRRYRRIRQADFVAAVVATSAVVLLGPLPGLGIAIGVSLLAIIYRASWPRLEVLGKISDEKAAWGRLRKHPERAPVAGVLVVRIDAPLFWANAIAIEDRLLAQVDATPGTRALVLDLEATTQFDTTSADMMLHLANELAARDVQLYIARALHRVVEVLERSGFVDVVGRESYFWHSISQCVRAARRDTGLKRTGKGRAGEPSIDSSQGADSSSVHDDLVGGEDEDVVEVLDEDAVEVLDDEDEADDEVEVLDEDPLDEPDPTR
jgi:high affinity sulfate transporter 1